MSDRDRYFVYKLIPPRPTFDVDATEDENAIMGRHGAYWHGLMQQGDVLVFGPVSASSGAWGLAVVRADDEAAVHEIAANDPAIVSGLATYEVGAMPVTMVPASRREGAVQ